MIMSDLALPQLFARILSSASKAQNLPTIQDETQVKLFSNIDWLLTSFLGIDSIRFAWPTEPRF